MAVKRIGLLGGSFDPVHLAHIALAQAALEALSLDQVQLLPAADPWQRPALAAPPTHRLAMLEIALRETQRLHINPLEIHRAGKTYTIDTLLQLPDDSDYIWILGADQLSNFTTWHRWHDIASLVHLAVAERPGVEACVPDALQSVFDAASRPLLRIPFVPMDVSASEIRRRLATGQSTHGLLDPAVAQYIEQHKLYAPAGS